LLIIVELYLKGSEQAGPDRLVADDWAQSGHDPSPARAARVSGEVMRRINSATPADCKRN